MTNNDFIPGNNWWMEAGSNDMVRGSFELGDRLEDATLADNPDNTNTDLFWIRNGRRSVSM